MIKGKKEEPVKSEEEKIKEENEKFNKILEKVKGIAVSGGENEDEFAGSIIGESVESGLSSSRGVRTEDLTLSSGLSLPEIADSGRANLEGSLAGVRTEKEDTEEKSKVYDENLYKPIEGLYSERDEQEELRKRGSEARVSTRMMNSAAFEEIRMPAGVEQTLQRVGMRRATEMSEFQSPSEEQLGKYVVGKRHDFSADNPLDSTADDRVKRVRKYEGRV